MQKVLSKYQGNEIGVNTLRDLLLGILFSPEYSWIDGIKFAIGNKRTADLMWGEGMNVNLHETIPTLQVPAYFVGGRQDYITPSVIVKEYTELLQAPVKEFHWFESSGHAPHFEEETAFFQLMLEIKQRHGSMSDRALQGG